METEARLEIQPRQIEADRYEITIRSGVVLGHLFLGLRDVVGTVMKRWPRNGQLLRRGSLQKTRVNAWEAQ